MDDLEKPLTNSTKKRVKASGQKGTCIKICRAIYVFFHNTKKCEKQQKKPVETVLEIVKESSDESAAIKKESGSSQEPLIEKTSSLSSAYKDSYEMIEEFMIAKQI
jgi:hypothetical protein